MLGEASHRCILAAVLVTFAACNIFSPKPNEKRAAADVRKYLQHDFAGGAFAEAATITTVEKLNGWDATRDGAKSYVMVVKLHVKAGSENSFAPPDTWLSDLRGEPGQLKVSRPIELEWRQTEQGWEFLGLTEKERDLFEHKRLAAAAERAIATSTMREMCAIARAWEGYATDHNRYTFAPNQPEGEVSAREVFSALAQYAQYLSRNDGWGTPFQFATREAGQWYVIRSAGSDRTFSHEEHGPTVDPVADIVYSNGAFVAYPSSVALSCP